ncbi:MAG: HAMP domain-containing histidine kinase [Acidobacteria bacterium]|nr:HAMP domain-containing histidine kinase [Acidobacteriota bacterium]
MKFTSSNSTLWMGVGIGLLVLLPALAVLQYQWIGEVSQAERERMQANLNTATTHFTQEFNHEIARASLAFQMDPATLAEKDWQRYAERQEQWQRTAPYPNLVKSVFFVEAAAGGGLRFLRLNAAGSDLEPAEWPPQYEAWRKRLEALAQGEAPPPVPGPGGRVFGWTIAEEIPALVLPLFQFPARAGGGRPNTPFPRPFEGGRRAGGPRRDFPAAGPPDGRIPPRPPLAGCSVIELNREFLQNQFVPELARKYFADHLGFAYQMAVVSRKDPAKIIYHSEPKVPPDFVSSADVKVNILGLRREDFIRFAVERSGTGRPVFEGPLGPGRGLGGLGGLGNPAMADNSQWQLVVKHRSGSLETAVAQARRRNLAISFSILLLLGGSVGMIIVSTRRAQRLAKLQMEFVASVSHELRTPLAVICSAADNLADGVVGARAQIEQYGSLIRGEGRRLSEMIDQILGFASLQGNHKKLDLRPVDVAGLIENTLQTSSPAIREAGVAVEQQIETGLPPVMADAQSIENCLQNLVGNALKYGGGGRWIGIRAGSTNGEVQISVEDKGPGIEPDDLPHIFEPFYRGAAVVGAQIHGTGLGLSLVKRIMEAQGGRVSVKSVLGQGSAFTLHLPVAT